MVNRFNEAVSAGFNSTYGDSYKERKYGHRGTRICVLKRLYEGSEETAICKARRGLALTHLDIQASSLLSCEKRNLFLSHTVHSILLYQSRLIEMAIGDWT